MLFAHLSSYRFHNAVRIFVIIVAAVFLPLSPHFSANVQADQTTSLSLQGFSGILNTPTGHVQTEGSLVALFSNQKDSTNERATTPWQNNYLFSVGMFGFAEIGGRLTAPKYTDGRPDSDLSVNAKISSGPLTTDLPFAPALALGIQDLSGGTADYRTTYLAASLDPLPWMRLSAGYGLGPNRMKGAFGGVELQAHDWMTLLGEYDTRDTNAGLRLTAPPLPWFPASLTFTAKTTLNRSSDIAIAFGLNMPLDTKKQMRDESKEKTMRDEGNEKLMRDEGLGKRENKDLSPITQDLSPLISHPSSLSQLAAIRSRLISAGFANVRVGVMGGTNLVVEYENVRYNHNELDAMGIVAGIASADDLEGIKTLWMVVKRKGLRMIWVSTPLREMRNWLANPGNVEAPFMQADNNTSPVEGTRFIDGDSNPDWLRPSLILYPGLRTYVGTEVGVFDALLSIKPDLQVSLWKGGVLNARWDLPVAWSDNFNDGRQFASDRNKPQMDRLMLFQGINLAPGLIANLGAGTILHGVNGTLNELTWSPGSGMHRFRLSQAYARNNDTHSDTTVWLGSYRMYIAPFDLFLEGTAGRFWGQDTGGVVTLKRFFGDTAVDLYAKSTETLEKKRWNAAGIQFSFPLTPRRDMARAPLQVRGTDEWGYAQETVLAIGGQKSNDTISAGLGIVPLPSADIYHSYLNRDRLNEDYILSHKQRLKEAWQMFRDSLDDGWPRF